MYTIECAYGEILYCLMKLRKEAAISLYHLSLWAAKRNSVDMGNSISAISVLCVLLTCVDEYLSVHSCYMIPMFAAYQNLKAVFKSFCNCYATCSYPNKTASVDRHFSQMAFFPGATISCSAV